ncbi:MAG: ABC transporter substrate-binding protein [Saezia sp.]
MVTHLSSRHLRLHLCAGALVLVTVWSPQVFARNLIIGIRSEPTSMDPQFHALTTNIQFSQTLFTPLVCNDSELLHQPCLAESWTPEGNTWIIKLRPNVKFSDGSDFTADDVVFTFKRIPLVPNSPSPFTVYLQQITDVEAVDPLTVKITTEKPYPLLPNNLTGLPIISAKAMAGSAPEGKTTIELNRGEGLVGTGPYRFVSWKRGNEIVFERNPYYWGEAPAWEKVSYRFISNPASRVAALMAGDVDLIEDPPTEDLARLRSSSDFVVANKNSNRVIYIALDQFDHKTPGITGVGDKNPLTDKRVREALSLAIDRTAIVDRMMGGNATPASEPLPYPMLGASQRPVQAADPNRAKELLAQAGYPSGFTLVLGTPNGRYINDINVAQAIAAMWSRIGIKTSVDGVAPAVFFKRRDNYEFSAYIAGWASTTGEASYPLNALLVTQNREQGKGTTNRGRYTNSKLDALVDEAGVTMDEKKRGDLLQQAVSIAMDDYALLPLHFEQSAWAMKKGILFQGRTDQMTLAQEIKPAQ